MTPEHTKKLTIVLADNLPEDLKALVAFLEQSGFQVEIARNGEAAIKNLEQFPQDLILVDVPTIRTLHEQLQAQNIHEQKEKERLKQEVEDELARYHEQVYDLVIERTQELTQRNEQLQQQIAEHKQAEQALRLSEQQYRLLAEHVADGVGIVQEGKLVFVNQALAPMFKYPPDHLLRIDPLELIRKEYQERGRKRMEQAEKGFGDLSWEVPCMTSDGCEIWVEARQSGIEWQGKSALLVTVRDITERKRQEIAIKEERNHLRQENIALRETIQDRYKLDEIIGKSPIMQDVYQSIVQAAASEATVLICGETGTGKDLVARTIHKLSNRKEEEFMLVNCGAVSNSLFEREFFGHRKGAFTGADRDRLGYFDRAHKGTLFLDELGELTPTMQAKLLRALEDKEYIPVGDTRSRHADVRIIAATNKDLKAQLQQGLIREDFFYRIDVITITLPPLRDRREDIPFLVDHFLKDYSDGKECCSMVPGYIIEALYKYDWPGNVRELQNELQRYLINQPLEFVGNLQVKSETKDDLFGPGDDLANLALPEALEAFEKRLIAEKLAQHHGNTVKTAEVLGISVRTLQRKIKKYRL